MKSGKSMIEFKPLNFQPIQKCSHKRGGTIPHFTDGVFLHWRKNMKFKILVTMIATLFVMTGCELIGPKVKVEGPKVKISGVQIEGDQSGKFCPPGQAKKGRC
ncbi:MAG: hypothetical protein ACYSUZ_07515 [Planctomycetota bacterium]